MDNVFFKTESAWHLLYTVIHNHLKFITYTLSARYARRLNQLKYAYFDRLQAAVILIKGLLSEYAKLIISFALNERTYGPGLLYTV